MNNRNHQKQEKHFIVDILFVLALFGVFAVSALALVTIGADVYQHTVEDMGVNYESRTAVSYIMEKVRQNVRMALHRPATLRTALPTMRQSTLPSVHPMSLSQTLTTSLIARASFLPHMAASGPARMTSPAVR